MKIRSALPLGLLSASMIASLVGCAEQAPAPGDASPPAAASSDQDPEIEAALASLSPEDRALAEKQKLCPVSKEPLGSMGTPIKVEVEGRSVLVCCDGCTEMVKENPEKYLSDLPAE